jgi:hypothetical protein
VEKGFQHFRRDVHMEITPPPPPGEGGKNNSQCHLRERYVKGNNFKRKNKKEKDRKLN